MGEISVTINGRNYGIACDEGQEQRVVDLGHYIDRRVREIAKAGAAHNENHLLVLASLMIADEVFELRDETGLLEEQLRAQQPAAGAPARDDEALAQAIDTLADRIDAIAGNIEKV